MINAIQNNQREFSFSPENFRFLASLAQSRTGIVLADHKKDMIYGRLTRRLRALDLNGFDEYCELIQSEAGIDEIDHLINAVTTNLTSFFREPHHFEHLRSEVLSKVTDKKFRIWSSACSSGMEPYSIAMTMKQAIPELAKWDAKILATDIDTNMLNIGREGEYNLSDIEDIRPEYKAFAQRSTKPGKLNMSGDLKKLITFNQLNLLEGWPMKGPFDAIFCRNVVIYFDKPTKQKLFARMADILKPEGWLYIGHSENLHGISDRFELVGRTIYRKVK